MRNFLKVSRAKKVWGRTSPVGYRGNAQVGDVGKKYPPEAEAKIEICVQFLT